MSVSSSTCLLRRVSNNYFNKLNTLRLNLLRNTKEKLFTMQERSAKLKWQFEKILKEPDVENKLELLGNSLSSKPDMAEYSNFLHKFPQFFSAVDMIYSQYDSIEESYMQFEEQVATVIQSSQVSSNELIKANAELENLNIAINAMLDGLGQGLLFFDKSGLCSTVHSKACLILLEGNPAGKHIADVLKLSGNDHTNIVDWVDLVFASDSALSFDDMREIAPSSYKHSSNFFIKLEYKPLFGSDGKIKNVLIIATDLTKEEEAKRQVQETLSKAMATLRIARNRNYFLRFIAQFREIFMESDFTELKTTDANFAQFKRDVHTIKGLSGTFHLDSLTQVLHDFESSLNGAEGEIEDLLMEYYYKLNENFNVSVQFAKTILGTEFETFGSSVSIQSKKIFSLASEIKENIKAGMNAEDISEKLIKSLIAVPVREIFANFNLQLQELADRSGKMVNNCLFVGENFVILPEKYEGMVSSLVHVARNIIDHAIDEPEVRTQFGKLPKGYITVQTEKDGDNFTISISDDGNGIDTDILRVKLASRINQAELDAMSDEELMQHIFDDNISTKDAVSELSGRGVGMSAVKAEVEKLGGKVLVTSQIGKGTQLNMTMPFIWN